MTPRGAVLYVPASNVRAMEKAGGLNCALIVDLEDAVAPDVKAAARDMAVSAIADGRAGRSLMVRINSLDTRWGMDDLAALADSGAKAILVPKIESRADIHRYHECLATAPADLRLWAMVETCRSALNLAEIAGYGQRLAGLVIGLNDMAHEMGAQILPGRAPFQSPLSQAVIAARANGLGILDAVFNDLNDDAGLEAECLQARAFGFDGKTVIHPRQIAICDQAFAPSSDEIAFARAVVAAFAAPENAGRGALRVGGRMVEHLHLIQAQRLLEAMPTA